jgi:hypothetical protein
MLGRRGASTTRNEWVKRGVLAAVRPSDAGGRRGALGKLGEGSSWVVEIDASLRFPARVRCEGAGMRRVILLGVFNRPHLSASTLLLHRVHEKQHAVTESITQHHLL